MNLNLGLESLNSVPGNQVIPFTPASAIEMQNAADAITNLMASLEGYYDAARNAMLVKRALRKYGKTQSIVALIGQEGLAAAQTFSMEGFWENIKNFLWKIWSKIKEWWGRFWGMFFSVEDKLRNFKSSLDGKILTDNCTFEAPGPVSELVKASDQLKAVIDLLKKGSEKTNGRQVLEQMKQLAKDYDVAKHGTVTSVGTSGTQTYVYKDLGSIKKDAESLIKIFEKHRNSKKDIDRYTDAYLRNIKDMKIPKGARPAQADVFGRDLSAPNSTDATAAENEVATNLIKQAGKINNAGVSSLLKDTTTVAVKMMANTRTKSR